MARDNCHICRFFEAGTALGDGDGECRRHNPRIRYHRRGKEHLVGSAWPVVTTGDWCGEYRCCFEAATA